VLTGIIVFIIVPLLGLLAYCLVSVRRRHLDDYDDSSDGGDAAAAGTPRGAKARSVIGDTALSCGSDEEAAATARDDDVEGGGGGGKKAAASGGETADVAA
jgi:hypothetical protein